MANGFLTVSVIDSATNRPIENATVNNMFSLTDDSIIYVKDEKAKAFIELQAPNVTVLVK